MCWNFEASAALAVAGTTATIYGVKTGKPKEIWIPLAFFTGMETLQAVQYLVIDKCGLPANEILTVIGYLHIAFQPFFINMIAMYFIPDKIRKKIAPYVYGVCGLAAATMVLQLYPFLWAGECVPGTMLCGTPLCSHTGTWHIAWDLPLNGLFNWFHTIKVTIPGYAFAGLLLPFLYGSWRFNIYHLLIGPILARQLTPNPNEAAAVWCLLSIGILILILGDRPLSRHMHVKKWIFWK